MLHPVGKTVSIEIKHIYISSILLYRLDSAHDLTVAEHNRTEGNRVIVTLLLLLQITSKLCITTLITVSYSRSTR